MSSVFSSYTANVLYQGEHDAEVDRSSQRSQNEREKFGDDSGGVIEDLSSYGHLAQHDLDDDDDDYDAMGGARGLGDGVLSSTDPEDLVTAIRSLEKTIAIHCKLMNRKLRSTKSSTSKADSKMSRPLPKMTVRGDKRDRHVHALA